MTTDHYATLGIDRNADAETIKAAYRRAAQAAHPDREGGSQERMQAINEAYRVLSDPQARERYDEIGSGDEPETAEKAAASLVVSLLKQAIDSMRDNPVEFAKLKVAGMKASANADAAEARRQISKLEKMAARVRVKKADAPNYIANMVGERIAALKQLIAQTADRVTLADLAMTIVDCYEMEPEPDAALAAFNTIMRGPVRGHGQDAEILSMINLADTLFRRA